MQDEAILTVPTLPKGRDVIGLLLALALAPGCVDSTRAPAPAPSAAASGASETSVAVLPNNMTVYASSNRLVAIKGSGEIGWELTLPDADAVVAPVAVAMNSVAYVRGLKAIHAALPDGKWLWSKPLDGRSFAKAWASDAPVALSDSTVALVIGDDLVRFDNTGAVRWRVTLPEGHVSNRLVAAMDGSLIVPTTAGIVCVSPEGEVTWRHAIAK